MCSLCTLLLAQQNVKAAPKNLGGSDRPDIHQTALLPFKLSRKKEGEGVWGHNSQNEGRPD